MQYTILIAAAFLLATIAVGTLSPFDNLPQRATPRERTIAPPAPEPPGRRTPDDEPATDDFPGDESDDEESLNAEPAVAASSSEESSDEESESGGAANAAPSSGDESFENSSASEGPDEEPVGE